MDPDQIEDMQNWLDFYLLETRDSAHVKINVLAARPTQADRWTLYPDDAAGWMLMAPSPALMEEFRLYAQNAGYAFLPQNACGDVVLGFDNSIYLTFMYEPLQQFLKILVAQGRA